MLNCTKASLLDNLRESSTDGYLMTPVLLVLEEMSLSLTYYLLSVRRQTL